MKTNSIQKHPTSLKSRKASLRFLIFFLIIFGNSHFLRALNVSGSSTVCPNSSHFYSIADHPAQPNGYEEALYEWTVTNGSPNTSTSSGPLYVTWSSTSGKVKVVIRYKKKNNSDITYTNTLNVAITQVQTPGAITGATNVQCGSTSPITYSVALVTNATSYQWTLPSGWTFQSGSNTTSNQVSVVPPANCQSGNICVVAKNSTCNLTSPSQCLYVKNENPVPVINGYTNQICTISAQDNTFSINALSGATSYSWSVTPSNIGVSIPGNNTGTSAVVHSNAGSNGIITLKVVAYFPYNKTTETSRTIYLSNALPPKPTFTSGGHTACLYSNNLKIYISNVPVVPSEYTWTFSGTPNGIKLIGGPSVTVIANQVGSYNVYATTTNICGTSPISNYYAVDVVNCAPDVTAVEESTDKTEISFYPNPAKNSFELVIPSKGVAQVKLISITGQVVKQVETHDQQTTVNVADITPGLYILNIITNGEIINKQIEITK